MYYLIFLLSVTSGLQVMIRGSTLLYKMTARALAQTLLLTEFSLEPLAQMQVNFTKLPPMVSSTNFAQMVPLN